MRNMRFGAKMRLYWFVTTVILVAVWGLSMYSSGKASIGGAAYQQIDQIDLLTSDVKAPDENLLQPYFIGLRYIDSTDEAEQKQLLQQFGQLEDAYKARHDYWVKHPPEDKEIRQELLVTSYNAAQHFFTVFDTQVAANVMTHNTDLIAAARLKLTQAYDAHEQSIDKAVAIAKKQKAAEQQQAEDLSSRSQRMTFLTLLVGLLAGALFSVLISRSIARPLSYITGVSNRIAQGDLSADIDPRYLTKEETGQLCRATRRTLERLNGYIGYIREVSETLEKMAQGDMRIRLTRDYAGEFAGIREALLRISASLNCTLSGISVSAERVQGGSEQLAAAARTLAEGSARQAETIETLSASVAEISGKIGENAESVRAATECVGRAAQAAKEGSERMQTTLEAMNGIAASSKKIGSIVKAIDDIAFQTNILALNAAVEAARAGEAGKGFSVVAEEVRRLASKSAQAAKQTGGMIDASVKSIAAGVQLAQSAGEAMQEVSRQTGEAEERIRRIDEASARQAEAIASVRSGVGSIAAVVQSNSAMAEQNAASSGELSQMAAALHGEVSLFRLDEAAGGEGPEEDGAGGESPDVPRENPEAGTGDAVPQPAAQGA